MSAFPASALDAPARTASDAMRRWAADSKEGLRVLLLARWPVRAVGAHLVSHYAGLHAQGISFTFVGPDGHALDALRAAFHGMDGLEFVPASVENRCCRLWPVVRGLLREGRFSVLHSHGLTAAAHAALANLGIGVPHLVTLHEPLRASRFPGWLGHLKNWTLTQALQRADAIATFSDTARANLLEVMPMLRGRADRIVTIPNGISITNKVTPSSSGDGEQRAHLGLDRDVFIIGFKRCFLSNKEWTALLNSVDLLSKLESLRRFHLLGLGSGDSRVMQQDILRRGLEKHVSLHDPSSPSLSGLHGLNLLVVPSASGAASLPAMEAMALGIPVLAADSPEMRELMQETPSRLTANDPTALAEQLQQAIKCPWNEQARAFAATARLRFDCLHGVRRLRVLLETLAVQNKQTARAA